MSDGAKRLEFQSAARLLQGDPVWALLLADRSPEAESSLRGALGMPAGDGTDDLLLLTAMRDAELVGAVAALQQPGRVALAWPPRCSEGEPASTAVELLRQMLNRLEQRGVQIVQAFPDAPNEADRQLLTVAAFEHVADLLYLASIRSGFPQAPPELDVVLQPYSPANHARLLTVLEQTYEGTLDCPRLNGVRSPEDVLATYRGTGHFDPARWFVVCANGRDVGCLLLDDHPADDQWELVYVGLVAAARGSGWGRQLVRHAQWLTRQAGRSRLVLSVDAANAPAIGLYASEGFVAWDRRGIYLRILGA